jgi:hypothetical protein
MKFKQKDPNKWAPAATTSAIPVELVIEATSADGIIKTDYYTITQYRPFLLLEEEDYFVKLFRRMFFNLKNI